MRLYRLSKIVFSIKNNPAKFLNGITANALDQPQNVFLDIHGKIVATCYQFKVSDDEMWIVIEKKYHEALMRHIDKFVRLSRVDVQKPDVKIYFDLDKSYPLNRGEYAIAQKAGQIIITPKDYPNTVSQEEFVLFRLKNNIPIHGVDYFDEMLLNVSETDFVSFTKGCFLGQEFVSKVHHKSKPPRKLIVVYEDEVPQDLQWKMTSKIKDPSSKKMMGFVFTSNR